MTWVRLALGCALIGTSACHGGDKSGDLPSTDEMLLGRWENDAGSFVDFDHETLTTNGAFCAAGACNWLRETPALIVVTSDAAIETVQTDVDAGNLGLRWRSANRIELLELHLAADGGER